MFSAFGHCRRGGNGLIVLAEFCDVIFEVACELARGDDFEFVPEGAAPAVKHIAYLDDGGESDATVLAAAHRELLAEPVVDRIEKFLGGVEPHEHTFAAEHIKRLPAVLGDIEFGRSRGGIDRLIGDPDIQHPVYAVICGVFVLVVIADEIVIVACEHHRDGIDEIAPAVLAQPPFPLRIEVKVLERHLPSREHPVLEGVDIVIDMLVGMLCGVEFDDVPLEDLGAVAAAERGYLVHEFRRLLLGDETRRLHGVDEHAQLRDIESPVHDIIGIAVLAPPRDDLIAELAKRRDVAVKRPAIARNAAFLKARDQLARGERMLLVALAAQDLPKFQQLDLGKIFFAHDRPPWHAASARAAPRRSYQKIIQM